MNLDKIKEEKVQLEQQREQLIAQVNQITGALAYIDKMLNTLVVEDCDKCEDDCVCESSEVETKETA